jgi:2,3-bisphosphoglycerate-independent phosphoglycerate mutase
LDKQTVVLMILDGFGLSDKIEGNAIALAETPHLDWLMGKFPFQPGAASGMDVGLPDGQMGNSEVGHTNIGAGRVVYQELTRISKEIAEGDFYTNEALLAAVENCKKHETALHLYGLLSDGGVHSHNTHLYALLELAKRCGLERVYVHAFLDGRDTPPASGKGYLLELEEKMAEIGVGKIATVMGRYYAMDRDNRWERVKIAYDAMVSGCTYDEAVNENDVRVRFCDTVADCMDTSYAAGINDEFVVPSVILSDEGDGSLTAAIRPNDSVIFYNFRPDRAREITRAFCDPAFTGFERPQGCFPLHYTCFTEYDTNIPNKHVAFHAQSMNNVLGQYLADKGMTQLRLAETEKYAHVTFFFNGGREVPYANEDRILVPSPKVATYDLQPEMSAPKVADELVKAINGQKYDLIVVNFANCDMVGHTGILEAAIKAVKTVDSCVAKAMDAMLKTGTRMFLCADHGNADKMIDEENGVAFTAHTTNPVPFALFNCPHMDLKPGGRLADIAPTLLDLMELEIPKEMTGKSLLIRK